MEITLREFRKSPFCRQDKSILRLINEKTTRKELPAIRNLYSTLTEIASNQARENISIYLFDIAKISGLSERTVSKGLDHLKKLGIVFMKPQER
jgi:methyltransferase-like protein